MKPSPAPEVAAPDVDNLGSLWRALTRFVAGTVSGKRPPLGIAPGQYIAALASAVRLHFFAFPAAAALAGAAAAARVDAPLGVAVAAAAAALALVLGLGVAGVVCALHPSGALLAGLAIVLLLVYQRAKAYPLLGNLAHGAMLACAAAIGSAAAMPDVSLAASLPDVAPALILVGVIAALYLQANYEKDRVGDAAAGYRTLAHVLGVRASAALRLLGMAAAMLSAHRLGIVAGPVAQAFALGAVLGTGLSAAVALRGGTEAASLGGYRFAIHATTAALLAIAASSLSPGVCAGVFVVGTALAEVAFRRSPNP